MSRVGDPGLTPTGLTVLSRAFAAWDAAYPTISGRVISDCPRQTRLPRPGFV